MNINRISKKFISSVVASALVVGSAFGLTGCGNADRTGRNMEIELINPVGAAESSVTAAYRSIYNSTSYSALVLPRVVEYAYDSSVAFYKYGNMPGEAVESGDSLILGDTTKLDEQIKKLRESISDMEENYNEKIADLTQALAEAKADMDYKEDIVNNLKNNKPTNDGSKTDDEYNAELNKWQKDCTTWDAYYGQAYILVEKYNQSIKETNELYELDHSYQVSSLNSLLADRNEVILATDMDGYVVACNDYEPGEYISGGVSASAVGDFDIKEIKCEFINSGIINRAEAYYAVVNGVKYDVEYQAIDTEEYDRLKELNGTVYSTFIVDDPENKIKIGDYAVIVVVNDVREDVLCVPKSAISTDESGSYVYKFNGSTYDITYIKTGISDGVYTEVLSGVENGDIIKSALVITAGKNEATLTYGSVGSSFSETGYLYYTDTQIVKTGIEYGIVYLDEICVSRYEQVTKGQTLIKVHVVSDTIEIARQERLLLRENEDLQKLIDEDKDRADDDKKNTKAIAQAQKRIAELQELINHMKSDGSTTEIVSPVDGIITEVLSASVGDLLNGDRRIATVADQSQFFIAVDDSNHQLTYGNSVEVSYRDNEGNSRVAEGTVVTINNMALSSKLQNDYALVQVPTADIALMAGSNRNSDGWWSRQSYNVTATIRSEENVLLIPRSAVTVGDSATFVTVKDENGTLRRVSFVAGGSDATNYWAAEGLTEGMVVCWE